MQPIIIENFINKETCRYLDNYFLTSTTLDEQGYTNIHKSKVLPFYTENYLFNTLDKNDPEQSFFYDVLKLIFTSVKAQYPFVKDDIEIELFNYRSFGFGQNFKEYHIDDYGGPGEIFTALLYLTDDYEGGEITFYDGQYPSEEGPIVYSPKAGSLFMFRAIDAHKVNPVISGKRALFSLNLRTPPTTEPITRR
jgi:hypothetical protein